MANHDDHAFSSQSATRMFRRRNGCALHSIRRIFVRTYRLTLERTETLGRRFRPVAEIGQLIPKRTYRGPTPAKSSSWNGSLLYSTLRQYEPEHPLVRENIRGVMRDMMDVDRAAQESARIFRTRLGRCSICRGRRRLRLPLFAAFSRETLLAQDPDKALDELVASLYDQWGDEAA